MPSECRGVRVDRVGSRLVIEAVPKPGADIALEVYTAHERSGLLASLIGLDVDVVAAA
jgi:hypothetical protein